MAIVRSIPPGRVATYGDVAVLAGRTGAARAVGNVMRHCADPSVPCHRVIAAGGALGGYTDPQRKKQALAAEGVTFAGRRIRRFAELRWDGRPRAGAAARPAPRMADRTPEGRLRGRAGVHGRQYKAQRRQPHAGGAPSNWLLEMTLAASPGLEAPPYDDDRRLVARCRAGEREACEELYQRHAPRILGLARRMVGPAEDAEDAVQDVFLAVFRKLDSFRGESSLATWLYRLAMNVCLDRLRSRGHRERRVTDEFDADDAAHVAAPPPAGRLSPGAAIDLERAIAALPEAARAAFLLHDVEGFDHREVGRILGIAEGTSKSQVHKARMRIRSFLHQPRTATAARSTTGR